MASAIKMDELLVKWLSQDAVHENVEKLILQYQQPNKDDAQLEGEEEEGEDDDEAESSQDSPTGVIPPFYQPGSRSRRWQSRRAAARQKTKLQQQQQQQNAVAAEQAQQQEDATIDGDASSDVNAPAAAVPPEPETPSVPETLLTWLPETEGGPCVSNLVEAIFNEEQEPDNVDDTTLPTTTTTTINSKFARICKEVCHLPSFFAQPLQKRVLQLYNAAHSNNDANGDEATDVTRQIFEWFWMTEMEEFDESERFFRLVKQPDCDAILRDDFLPYIKELLNEHPGLEFLSNHAEFQEKYAVTVITRIFYTVNKCHSGRITLRQIRRSDLLETFLQVDQEEDINKVTRYFSYEHFYVLYCRFWELDHDRDYRITREDLLKYGDHSLSHMIVDRIFDAAPRPFDSSSPTSSSSNKSEFLSYEDFIFFMLSEEDKSNEVSVRYWFTCVDVDGDDMLNNMEMRSFYAVQLHRMQCMGHEIVPFEDMLCQMMDMIKPQNPNYLVPEDFLQAECAQVSGALFDALFNLNKYLMFEQRDPFVERQKREDEFETDWDRFACIDYNRLAMEEEAREEEAMEIDWVTVDEDEEDEEDAIEGEDIHSSSMGGASEAPF